MYSVPILLIIFKRLDTTKKVFSKIQQIKPKELYVAADAPRENNNDEKNKCYEVRNWVLNSIDWDCNVKTLFRDQNLGCGRGVSTAIDWFFSLVDYGIILEDDCVPDISFFSFVENLLLKYKDNKDIWQISGFNNMGINPQKNKASYSFTAIEACWGWATWKDRWQKFTYDISSEDINQLLLNPYFKKKYRRDFWFPKFESMTSDVRDIWDYQWTYRILVNQGYCIIPSNNLIENCGFGNDSTHFSEHNIDSEFHLPTYEISSIIHPKVIKYDWKLIKYTDKKVFGIPQKINLNILIIRLLKSFLRKIGLFDYIKKLIKK